jgi:DNA polymerase III subunit delta
MVAVRPSDAESFVARPDPKRPIVLLFGPDAGLVRERAEAIVRASVDNTDDPFSLVRIDGDDLSGNPLRLVEEANTIPLFGGKRAVWVKAGSRNIVPAVEALIGAPSPDCRVVIEAGDLRRNAALRVVCEKAKTVAAIACYPDAERDLARLIDEEMREAGLTMAPDVRAVLVPFLGGDRQATRSELRKLALYAHGRGQVTVEDVLAVAADASALALDGAVDAAFAGRLPDVEQQFAKARAAGTSPGSIVSGALRQLAQLHRLRLAVESGSSVASAVENMRPPPHFRRKPLIEAAVNAWTAERLVELMAQLAQAVLETRLKPNLADAIAQRALLSTAMNARRRQ